MAELYLSGGDTLQSVDHPNWQGQTFVLQEDFILQFVDLEMRGGMIIPNPVIQVFHAEITGEPWGDCLSRDRHIVEKKSGAFTTGRVRFSMQPVLLARPARYVLIVSNFPGLIGNPASWQYDKDDATYPRGIRISSNDGGATWTPHYNDDFMFALFGSPPLISPEPAPPLENFANIDLEYFYNPSSITITLITSVPCHLWCYYTDIPPRKYMTSRTTRGLAVPWHVYYSFVEWSKVEQTELGDTMTHTFEIPDWPKCSIATPSPTPSIISLSRKLIAEDDECRVWWSGTEWKYDFAHHETIPGYIVSLIYASGYAMIFRNLNIPKEAIIDGAKVRFTTSGETTNPNIKTRIQSQLTVDPLPFTTIEDYLARNRTPNPIPWDDIEAWYVNQQYYSPDIAPQIQPIIDLPAWEAGKSICLFWDDHDDRSAHIDYTTRFADTFHHDADRCPQLIIQYHTPPPPPRLKTTPARWFTFRGEVDNIDSPSVGPIFQHCLPPLPLFQNLSFEDYPTTPGIPTHWKAASLRLGVGTYSRDNINVQEGIYSCKIKAVGDDFIARLEQYRWSTPYLNKTVKFTFNWWGGGRWAASIWYWSAGGFFGGGWHTISKTFTFGSTPILLRLRIGTRSLPGESWELSWDNLKIEIL